MEMKTNLNSKQNAPTDWGVEIDEMCHYFFFVSPSRVPNKS